MIRKSVQAAMTADRMSVSLDRFFLIEPERGTSSGETTVKNGILMTITYV